MYYKPSQVNLIGATFPLLNCMHKIEFEMAAALITRTCCIIKNDVWAPISFDDIQQVITRDMTTMVMPWARFHCNPFLRPDFLGLVKNGYAQWVGEEGNVIEFTLYGFDAMRIWVKE
jgi:hypothetical protein